MAIAYIPKSLVKLNEELYKALETIIDALSCACDENLKRMKMVFESVGKYNCSKMNNRQIYFSKVKELFD